MQTKTILCAALLAALSSPALAYDAEGDSGDEARVEKRVFTINGGAAPFQFEMMGPMEFGFPRHGKLVKNAPYSAEVVSETVQTLADGNQITNKHSQLSYRDSAGRTRQEVRDAKGEVRVITISDAEGVQWTLHPQSKTATKISMRDIGKAAGDMAKAKIEALKKEGKLASIEHDGEHVIVKRLDRDGEAGKAPIRENIEVRVAQHLKDGKAPNGEDWGSHFNMILGNAVGDSKWSRKSSTKDLGSKDIDGVKAEGKLRSYDIPAGEVGNKNAIVVSDESWYAPDLQITVYSKHSDPRSGDRIYRLANLKREEPKADLFTVPADYKVTDAMAQVRTRIDKAEKAEKN